jgi:putative ABC transport system ATP-binding protein
MNYEKPLIEVRGLKKIYTTGDVSVEALKGINLSISNDEFVAVMGASGSGKSTFMNILGCLDSPTEGEYYLEGSPVNSFSKDKLAEIRNSTIGFVFQGFNLLSRTTALDNVELPLLYSLESAKSSKKQDTKKIAKRALENLGLSDRIHHYPNQLSGGQQQRVAIARALVSQPSLILADEPTGNLDSRTSVEIMAVFQKLNEQGISIVLVTHEMDIAQYAKRIVEFRDGHILRDHMVPRQMKALDVLREWKDLDTGGDL